MAIDIVSLSMINSNFPKLYKGLPEGNEIVDFGRQWAAMGFGSSTVHVCFDSKVDMNIQCIST